MIRVLITLHIKCLIQGHELTLPLLQLAVQHLQLHTKIIPGQLIKPLRRLIPIDLLLLLPLLPLNPPPQLPQLIILLPYQLLKGIILLL